MLAVRRMRHRHSASFTAHPVSLKELGHVPAKPKPTSHQTLCSQHKEKPEVLLRVGDTLWRRAAEGAAAVGVHGVLADGVASVANSRVPSPRFGPMVPPPVQLTRIRDSGTNEVGGHQGTFVCGLRDL